MTSIITDPTRPITFAWPSGPGCPGAHDWAPEPVKRDRHRLQERTAEVGGARAAADDFYRAAMAADKDPTFDRRPFFVAVASVCRLQAALAEEVATSLRAEALACEPIRAASQTALDEIVEGARRKLKLPDGQTPPIQYLWSLPAWWIAKREAVFAPNADWIIQSAASAEAAIVPNLEMADKYEALAKGEAKRLEAVAEFASRPPRAPTAGEMDAARRRADASRRREAAEDLLQGVVHREIEPDV